MAFVTLKPINFDDRIVRHQFVPFQNPYTRESKMVKTLMVLTAWSLLIFSSPNALASEAVTFRIISQASGKCISLKAPDQNDGGGVTMRDCQNFPDFFVTVVGETSQLQFRLSSSNFICVVATDNPSVDPPPSKVMTQNCVGPGGIGRPGNFWNLSLENVALPGLPPKLR